MIAAQVAALGLTLGLAVTGAAVAIRLDQAFWRTMHVRAALLAAPTVARRTACPPPRGMCHFSLALRQGGSWVPACGVPPRQPEPARYYRLQASCRIWPTLPRQRLLDLIIFR